MSSSNNAGYFFGGRALRPSNSQRYITPRSNKSARSAWDQENVYIDDQNPQQQLPSSSASRSGRRSSGVQSAGGQNYYQPGMGLHDNPPFFDFEGSDQEDCGRSIPTVSDSTSEAISDMKVLLQQQQAMLRTILTKQETMETKQSLFEDRISQLEEKVTVVTPPSSSNDSSPSGKKRKRVVTRELSVSVVN